ncbi:MAG: hypothetical protein ACRC92_05465 [Peptostreptococcaceae bacterium]
MNEEKIVIKDAGGIWKTASICFLGILAIVLGAETTDKVNKLLLITPGILFVILGIFAVKEGLKGVVIDAKNDMITFSGGGITFNKVSQSLLNLHQDFKRYTFRISDIHHISTKDNRNVDKDGKISYSYKVTLTTINATATLSFSNSAQRDQVYSIIVNLNDMGIPVQNR